MKRQGKLFKIMSKKIAGFTVAMLVLQPMLMVGVMPSKAFAAEPEEYDASVESFTLVNADTDTDIGTIGDGDIINLDDEDELNIRANTSGEIGSVEFISNLPIDSAGNPLTRIESTAPYASAGDTPPGSYYNWTPSLGIYTLTATPFSGAGASGDDGTPLTITFSVIDVPTLAEVTPVEELTNESSPEYTFSSTRAGMIVYGGDCSSATIMALAGNNTINFEELADGDYDNCTITVIDENGNVSLPLIVTPFEVDTTKPADIQGLVIVNDDTAPTGGVLKASWEANTEEDLDGYRVDWENSTDPENDGSLIVAESNYDIAGLINGVEYNVSVVALDKAGNESNEVTESATPSDVAAPVLAVTTTPELITLEDNILNITIVPSEALLDAIQAGVSNIPVEALPNEEKGLIFTLGDRDPIILHVDEFGNYGWEGPITEILKGELDFTLSGEDLSGNPVVYEGTVNVDTIAPETLAAPQAISAASTSRVASAITTETFTPSSAGEGEVKASEITKDDDQGQADDKGAEVKETKKIPLWGIIFLLILAAIGGYLFYVQNPENSKK